MIMLRAVDTSGVAPTSVNEVEELFSILVPVIHARNSRGDDVGAASVQESDSEVQEEDVLVSKLVHLLDHENVDVAYEMIFAARIHLGQSGNARVGFTLAPVVFSALRLANRIAFGEDKVNAIPTPAAVPEPDDGEGVDGDSKNDTAGVGDSAEDMGVKETPLTDEVESKLQATALAENPELPVETAPTLRYVLFPTASGRLNMLLRSHACPSTVAGRYCSLSRALSR
jgi:vacuolar protein sorting-associated protein 35